MENRTHATGRPPLGRAALLTARETIALPNDPDGTDEGVLNVATSSELPPPPPLAPPTLAQSPPPAPTGSESSAPTTDTNKKKKCKKIDDKKKRKQCLKKARTR
jgi:hypothetical protein